MYTCYKAEGEDTAKIILEKISKQPIIMIDTLSDDLLLNAAKIKSNYKMSLADSVNHHYFSILLNRTFTSTNLVF
jgi:hypothetical protein